MNIADAIANRRSVRGFLPQDVPQEDLQAIFQLAQHAPSNCNTQPWVVHVVSGAALRQLGQRLCQATLDPAQHAPDFPYDGRYEGVYRERQQDSAAQLFNALGIAREDKAGRARSFLRNFDFFEAPHAAFIFLPEPFGLREAADCGLYAQTLMLAMKGQGVASCPQTSLTFHPTIVREMLGVPAAHKLLLGISFGYEDPQHAANLCRVSRAPLEATANFHS